MICKQILYSDLSTAKEIISVVSSGPRNAKMTIALFTMVPSKLCLILYELDTHVFIC